MHLTDTLHLRPRYISFSVFHSISCTVGHAGLLKHNAFDAYKLILKDFDFLVNKFKNSEQFHDR